MSPARLDQILDAAYQCFTRHGMRRTTMDDIAEQAGISRPALYQYVRNKDEIFGQLAERMFARCLDRAGTAAEADHDLTGRVRAVLDTKLELVLGIWADSPHHGAELIGAGTRISAPAERRYRAGMAGLLTHILDQAANSGQIELTLVDAEQAAALLLALAQGLEADLADPGATRDRMHRGVAIFIAGLTAGRAAEAAGPAGTTNTAGTTDTAGTTNTAGWTAGWTETAGPAGGLADAQHTRRSP